MLKHLINIAAILALPVGGAAHAAERLCQDCILARSGTYVGAFWPGEQGTFQGGATIAPNTEFDEFYVFDLNDTSSVTFTAQTTTMVGLRIELHYDLRLDSVCDASTCSQIGIWDVYCLTRWSETGCVAPRLKRRVRQNTGGAFGPSANYLVPGRYVLRVIGQTGATAGTYTGAITVRAAVSP